MLDSVISSLLDRMCNIMLDDAACRIFQLTFVASFMNREKDFKINGVQEREQIFLESVINSIIID